jgi:hypothetical protein
MRPTDASSKTVRLYGETMQRRHGGFVRRSQRKLRATLKPFWAWRTLASYLKRVEVTM